MENEIAELVRDVREQVIYLRELGVEELNVSLPEPTLSTSAIKAAEPGTVQLEPRLHPEVEPTTHKARAGARLASMPSLTRRASAASTAGIENLSTPSAVEQAAANLISPGETLLGDLAGLPESSETVEQIWADIGNCTRCPLHEGRTQIVHTVGNYQSDLMFIGEAPGADEDAKGEPFVGRAGKLLDKIIEAIGMTREEVCIGNINRCRPPGNRQPTLPEAHTCKPFLLREIAVIRPKVIVVMGNTALHNLLDTKIGITRMRGQFHEYFGVKVMPTFHPAYLLRDPSKKREVWDDMKKVRDYLNSLAN